MLHTYARRSVKWVQILGQRFAKRAEGIQLAAAQRRWPRRAARRGREDFIETKDGEQDDLDLPEENRNEITPPVPETLCRAIRQHLNKHLIGACREVFAHPLVYVVLRSPSNQSFREPIAAVAREVIFAEALAEPAVAVVRQPQVGAQVGAGQP